MKNSHIIVKSFILILILHTPTLIAREFQWEQPSGPHGSAIYSVVSDNTGMFMRTRCGAQVQSNQPMTGIAGFLLKMDCHQIAGNFTR